MRTSAELRNQIESALAARIPAALSPRPLQSCELVSCGVDEVNGVLGGGLPLGAIVEFTGPPSSGRTTLALSTLAGVTREGHCCAYVDACDALDPLSAAAVGVDLPRMLWVRPRQTSAKSMARLEVALRATDLLLNTGGFRVVVLDLADVAAEQAQRTPMTTWYRFRLQAEKSRTLLLVLTPAIAPGATATAVASPASAVDGRPVPAIRKMRLDALPLARASEANQRHRTCAQSCASLSLHCDTASPEWQQAEANSPRLLSAMRYRVTVQRSRAQFVAHVAASPNVRMKKPPASSTPKSETQWRGATSWTG